jgi:hypothetical protein
MCVCSISYPAYRAHAPLYVAIVVCLSVPYFFPRSLINGTIFVKKIIDIKCEFFLYKLCLKRFSL